MHNHTPTRPTRFPISQDPLVRVLPGEGQPNAVSCTIYPPALLPKGQQPGLVIHLYGRGGSHTAYNLARPPYAGLRALLAARGCMLVVPELGTDHWMNDQAVQTLDAIIKGLTEAREIDPQRVSIIGTSMGGGSGLAYVIQRPAVIRSICAIFPFTDFGGWLKEAPHYAAGIAQAHGVTVAELPPVLNKLSAMQHVDAFAKVPVFLVHGGADTLVPTHQSTDFAAALRARHHPVIYREAPGIGHDDAAAAMFQTEIADFLTGQKRKK
jgi:dipeptidyl aminopeptidase/acylaminoacyl peptidase